MYVKHEIQSENTKYNTKIFTMGTGLKQEDALSSVLYNLGLEKIEWIL